MTTQRPQSVLLKIERILSREDIDKIDTFADQVKASMPQNFEARVFADDPGKGGNEVTYMNEIFQQSLAHIHSKIIESANAALVQKNWLPLIQDNLGVRCIERLEYRSGGHLDWHEDIDSVYTLILFLSQFGVDFEGGELQIRAGHLRAISQVAGLGSMLLFRSEYTHAVAPVLRGKRTVLVMEFWRFRDASRHDLRPDIEYGVPFETR